MEEWNFVTNKVNYKDLIIKNKRRIKLMLAYFHDTNVIYDLRNVRPVRA